MKKVLKITGIALAVLLLLLILTPFIFKSSLEKLLKKTINEHAPVTVEWNKLDISLIRSFPKSTISLSDFSVVTHAPFEGDTLASGKKLRLEMGIMQLIKQETPLTIDAFELDGGLIQIKTDKEGRANYDFSTTDTEEIVETDELDSDFSLALTKYAITNTDIHYWDEKSGIFLSLNEVQHTGKGDFSMVESELDTHTQTTVSFTMEGTKYLNQHLVTLDAVIGMDLNQMRFSFLENEAKINDLALIFEGYVQLFDEYTDVAINFNTPSSDFKNFLQVIPQDYLQHLEGVQTTGNFEVQGKIEGKVDDTYIPRMDIQVSSNNASFNYPDLPKSMEDIFIDIALKNETGLIKDMFLEIGTARFRIDNNKFGITGSVHNFMENALVDLNLNGTLNLGELKEVLPLEDNLELAGVFKADMQMKFDMESIEKERYDRVVSRGNASLSDFVYSGDAFKNDFHITNTQVSFNPQNIRLESFNALTGKTDLKANGNIENFIPFIMNGKELKGRFTLHSDSFHLDDFMVEEDTTETDKEEKNVDKSLAATKNETFKIPSFLDVALNFDADEVFYDNLVLRNIKGTVAIADEKASISNFQSDLLGGLLALSGDVSTADSTPKFNMDIGLQKVKIEETFKNLDFIRFIAPIANAFEGLLDTQFTLSGDLSNDFTPKMETLKGNALLDILSAKVHPSDNPLVSQLNNKLEFLNLNELQLKDIHTKVQFDNGEIQMQPLEYQWKDMKISLDGKHSLTNQMQYNANLDIPAKYLGKEAVQLLNRLSPEEAEEKHVVLPIQISGSGVKPQVKIDTKAAITALTADIIDHQKDKAKEKIDEKKEELEDKLKDEAKKHLDGLFPGRKDKDSVPTDSTKTKKEKTEDKIKEGLKDLFGKGKNKE